jgi:hypothetical protein
MPQFDFSSFFTQVVWVLFFSLVLYFYISLRYLPIIGYYLKTRKSRLKKNFHIYVPYLESHSFKIDNISTYKKIIF